MAEKLTQRNLSPDRSEIGLVQVFTGEGKGKTSAALGTALRAIGHGMKVHIIFFMKGEYPYGERTVLRSLPNVTVASFGTGEFVDPAKIKLEQIAHAGQALTAAREAVASGNYNMVILDEVNLAAAWKLISIDDLLGLIKNKPPGVDLILTGRLADPKLIQIADLVTEMVKIKHPYDQGIPARMGSEY